MFLFFFPLLLFPWVGLQPLFIQSRRPKSPSNPAVDLHGPPDSDEVSSRVQRLSPRGEAGEFSKIKQTGLEDPGLFMTPASGGYWQALFTLNGMSCRSPSALSGPPPASSFYLSLLIFPAIQHVLFPAPPRLTPPDPCGSCLPATLRPALQRFPSTPRISGKISRKRQSVGQRNRRIIFLARKSF